MISNISSQFCHFTISVCDIMVAYFDIIPIVMISQMYDITVTVPIFDITVL